MQIYEIKERIRENTPEHSVAQFIHFAELKLVDMASPWNISEPEQRHRVHNLLFHDGLDDSPERGMFEPLKLFSQQYVGSDET